MPPPTFRRALTALTAAIVLAQPASAQVGFKLAGGVDLTRLFGGGVGDTQQREGLGFGGSLSLLSMGPATLVAEGYYRQKGAKGVQELGDQLIEGGSAEIGLDYVEVPLLLRLNLPTLGTRVLPYVQGGPAFAWRIACSIKLDATSSTTKQDCADLTGGNLSETLRDYEQGLVLGGGIDVAVGSVGALNVDARLTQGLSRINEMSSGGAVKNRVFSVMLGYSFGLPAPLSGMGGGMGMVGR